MKYLQKLGLTGILSGTSLFNGNLNLISAFDNHRLGPEIGSSWEENPFLAPGKEQYAETIGDGGEIVFDNNFPAPTEERGGATPPAPLPISDEQLKRRQGEQSMRTPVYLDAGEIGDEEVSLSIPFYREELKPLSDAEFEQYRRNKSLPGAGEQCSSSPPMINFPKLGTFEKKEMFKKRKFKKTQHFDSDDVICARAEYSERGEIDAYLRNYKTKQIYFPTLYVIKSPREITAMTLFSAEELNEINKQGNIWELIWTFNQSQSAFNIFRIDD